MNRREWLGVMAGLGAGALDVLPADAASGVGATVAARKRYLGSIIDEAYLKRHLLPAGAWRPYPKAGERDGWRAVPATLKICACLDHYLRDYSDDGACEEGPGYWSVSAGSYLDCLLALSSATGGKVNLADDPFVWKMGHYLADVHIAGDWYVNYGDAHAKAGHSPQLLYRFGKATGDRELMAFGAFRAQGRGFAPSGQGRLARDLPDLLDAGAARSAARADALTRASRYPALA